MNKTPMMVATLCFIGCSSPSVPCIGNGCTVEDGGIVDAGVQDGGQHDAGQQEDDAGPSRCGTGSFSGQCQAMNVIVPSRDIYFVGHGENAERIRFFLPTSDADAGTFDHLTVERWTSGPAPTLPYVYSIAPSTYDECANCVFIRQGCALAPLADGGLTLKCEKMFLAQSGSITFEKIGAGMDGAMAGFGCNLHFVQWDFRRGDDGTLLADAALPDGGCLDLLGYHYDISYRDYGQSFDAGR